MLQTALLLFSTTVQPPTQPPSDVADQVTRSEVVPDDSGVQVIAYDSMGAVVGSIGYWVDSGGTIVIVSDFSDGYSETRVTSDGAVSTVSDLDQALLEGRAAAIIAALDVTPSQQGQRGILGCGLSIAATVIVAPAGGIPAVLAGIATACNCAPLVGNAIGVEGVKCHDLW
jgi:hypothetical protein